jgi:hypothetical protein
MKYNRWSPEDEYDCFPGRVTYKTSYCSPEYHSREYREDDYSYRMTEGSYDRQRDGE